MTDNTILIQSNPNRILIDYIDAIMIDHSKGSSPAESIKMSYLIYLNRNPRLIKLDLLLN